MKVRVVRGKRKPRDARKFPVATKVKSKGGAATVTHNVLQDASSQVLVDHSGNVLVRAIKG